MTREEYWEMSPHLAVAYRKAYRLKRQTENEQAWLQGMYIYDAVAACIGAALAKRGSEKPKYVERPFDIFPLTEREKKQREKEEREKMQAYLRALQQQQRNTQKGD